MQETSGIIKAWVNEYSSDLLSWAFYKTSNKETAEDLVQETFISAFQSFHTFENKSKPKTWLFSILKNKIIDFHRKNYKRTVVSADKISEQQSTFLFSYLFEDGGEWRKERRPENWTEEVVELLDNPEFNELLMQCIRKLPPLWNSAIQLKYLEQKDAGTICQELGVSTTNYWQIIHRAKLQLRECLQQQWFKK
ncbi:sigma-70 family RNA polymerase sigma factor [Cytophaga hutchinsonii]|uniref:RNA polymerase sigma factor n=1 Tax=Cytophaga hutchinsonii (strain ATCC 33406 / DSM 1761 / CIP 103989 / NBRC 15051 / NCIMB 9469 / D465) TaxID=269798 RepID=A0A6N4SVH7_CYTH3|nr:sigma-70 family RNA polymerase sigma factor [Cytophaga hutchinsonii]ABG60337.1 possible ECF-family RNA polymerase sigma factor [Cytophaga hutchinsonii ATCC 33406]SFX98768.1 RNA polymerase sigma-70 factor, ECF subfamily [Cytophaga hutchinsonii ATCC 33406]